MWGRTTDDRRVGPVTDNGRSAKNGEEDFNYWTRDKLKNSGTFPGNPGHQATLALLHRALTGPSHTP
ncbi:hypothetical protein EAG_10665 [Camponotus floridanus]|uniref:Uncharacterized protein n=1 Tax=Camponotus floridanus TaxID=104421 RepID=E2A603_CAMFO|nr:hypothetical protein EAG_10665 [Camponotus floridanus]